MTWGFLCVSIDLNKIGTSLVVYGLKMQLVKHDIRSLSSAVSLYQFHQSKNRNIIMIYISGKIVPDTIRYQNFTGYRYPIHPYNNSYLFKLRVYYY